MLQSCGSSAHKVRAVELGAVIRVPIPRDLLAVPVSTFRIACFAFTSLGGQPPSRLTAARR